MSWTETLRTAFDAIRTRRMRSALTVLGIFARLNHQGRTIVLITHEVEVAAHAGRVIRVRDGRIVADEPGRHVEVAA